MKNLLILLMCLLIITGCFKKDELPEKTKENQNKIISNLTKVDEDDILIKFTNNNKEESYYFYRIEGVTFSQYLYTFHKSKESFNEAIKKYQNDTYYALERLDDSLITIITLQKGSDESAKEVIENQYKDDKDYEIIK